MEDFSSPGNPASQPTEKKDDKQPDSESGQGEQAEASPPTGSETPPPRRNPEDLKFSHIKRKTADDDLKFSHINRKTAGRVQMSEPLGRRLLRSLEGVQEKSGKGIVGLFMAVVGGVSFGIKNRKKILVSSLVAFIVLLVAVIAPLIPAQIKRGNAFSAVDDGHYEEAYRLLEEYAKDRPNDQEAAFRMAKSAIRIGKVQVARPLLDRLLDDSSLSDSTDMPYYQALIRLDRVDQAVPHLDRFLARNPDHVGARLLRGYLLRGDLDSVRKAREDFIQADRIIRAQEVDERIEEEVRFLHGFLQEHSDRSVRGISDDLRLHRSAAYRGAGAIDRMLDFPPPVDGFFVHYLYTGEDFLADGSGLSVPLVIGLYFVRTLMAGGELEEAKIVIKEVRSVASDSPLLDELEAFLAVYEKNFSLAVERFSALAERFPGDIQTRKNLSYALLAAGNTNLDELTKLYSDLRGVSGDDVFMTSNFAYAALLAKDVELAAEGVAALLSDEEKEPIYQANFIDGMIGLFRHDLASAADAFGRVSDDDMPGIGGYQAIVHAHQGDYGQAVEAYRRAEARMADSDPLRRTYFLNRIGLMEKSGDIRLAELELRGVLEEFPEWSGARYFLGRYALLLGDPETYQSQRDALSSEQALVNGLVALENRLQGNEGAAVSSYQSAMESVELPFIRRQLTFEWAELLVDSDPQSVTERLSEALQFDYAPELEALLGYAYSTQRPIDSVGIADGVSRKSRAYPVRKYVGLTYLKVGNYGQAERMLGLAWDWYPAEVALLRQIASTKRRLGDAEEFQRLRNIVRYMDLSREERERLTKQAKLKIYLPDSDEKDLVQAIKKSLAKPSSDPLFEDALRQYDAVLNNPELKPSEKAEFIYSRASYYLFQQRFERAIRDFEQALSIGFSNPEIQREVMLYYARVLMTEDRYNQSAQVLEQALERFPDDPSPLYLRSYASALNGLGRSGESRQVLLRVTEQYPDDYDSYLELAKIDHELSNLDSSEQTLRLLMRIAPTYSPAYGLLSKVLSAAEREEESIRYRDLYSEL